jgi:hypothetical protein
LPDIVVTIEKWNPLSGLHFPKCLESAARLSCMVSLMSQAGETQYLVVVENVATSLLKLNRERSFGRERIDPTFVPLLNAEVSCMPRRDQTFYFEIA